MRLIQCIAVWFGLALPVVASGPDCALVARLDAWVSEATELSGGTDCAQVGFGTFSGAALHSQSGAYYPETGKIEIAPDLDLSAAYGQSFLVHELTHAAQARRGGVACEGQLEAEAYGIQARFLKENGLAVDARAMVAMASLLGQCGAPEY